MAVEPEDRRVIYNSDEGRLNLRAVSERLPCFSYPLEGRAATTAQDVSKSRDYGLDAVESLLLGEGDATIAADCAAHDDLHS